MVHWTPAILGLAALFFLFGAANGQGLYRRSAVSISQTGPKQWLKQVSGPHRKEINAACKDAYPDVYNKTRRQRRAAPEPDSNKIASNDTAEIPEERIVYGDLAEMNQFPHAVSLAYKGVTQKGFELLYSINMANIISRHHLLTVGYALEPIKYTLSMGGVCLGNQFPDGEKNCPRGNDMLKPTPEIDFAIKPYGVSSRSGEDFDGQVALVQLRSDLGSFKNSRNKGRINFGCLPPSKGFDVPNDVLMNGFGYLSTHDEMDPKNPEQALKGYAERLHFHQYITHPKQEWNMEENPECKSPNNFCSYSPDGSNSSGTIGDGGTALTPADSKGKPNQLLLGMHTADRFVTNVVTTKGGAPTSFDYDVNTRVSDYVEDICLYIGLCLPGSMGLWARLRLGSIYIDRPRSSLYPLPPFIMLTDEESKKASPNMLKPNLDQLGYMGTGTDSAMKCLLVPITPCHAVTSRSCLIRAIKSKPKPRLTFVQIYPTPNPELSLDFFAWQNRPVGGGGETSIAYHNPYYNDLAIVQFKMKNTNEKK